MKRVLITGISGTGKSTVTEALAARGYQAIDADSNAWSEWMTVSDEDEYGGPVEPGRDWVWREERIRTLFAMEAGDLLFVSGCAPNMRQFLPQFDHIFLLTASPEITVARLSTRTNNTYGKHPDEMARVLRQKASVEPHLRAIAGHEIDTDAPIEAVVAMVLKQINDLSPS